MNVWATRLWLAATLLCSGMPARAQDARLTQSWDNWGPAPESVDGPVIPGEMAAGYAPADVSPPGTWRAPLARQGGYGVNGACGEPDLCGGCGPWCDPAADALPRIGSSIFSGFDTWRGIGGSQYHNGIVTGANLGVPVPWLEEFGVGSQLGASYGAYNFGAGNQAQEQTFVTMGFFRRADANRPFSAGLVYDGMFANNFQNSGGGAVFTQGRAQIAYALSSRAEIGFWAAWRDRGDTEIINGNAVSFTSVSQGNLFWHQKWRPGGLETWGWVGRPDWRVGQHRTSQCFFGGALAWPVTDGVALLANAQYLASSRFVAGVPAPQSGYSATVGLAFFPGRAARSRTVAGRAWQPYLPAANNGNFMLNPSAGF